MADASQLKNQEKVRGAELPQLFREAERSGIAVLYLEN